jgi:hypothetical protein
MDDLDFEIREPQCEGCGERPEVYGSSWCSSCHRSLPEYAKRRILTLRNALIMIGFRGSWGLSAIRGAAKKALEKPLPDRLRHPTVKASQP